MAFISGRTVSTVPRSNGLQNTWRPQHGIVFNSLSNASTPRNLSKTTNASAEHDDIIAATLEVPEGIESKPAVQEAATAEEILPGVDVAEDPEQKELPKSTTAFRMSEDVFRAARNAEPGSSESYWSHTLYRGPADDVSGVASKVRVHYCKKKHTTEQVLQRHFMNKKVLGFDIEWKTDTHRLSGAKKNVSLVQLASEERIALFHIAMYAGDKTEDLVAPSLKRIMEDPAITKVGVAIKGDCTRLRNNLDIHAQGIFELSHLHKLVKCSASRDFNLINKKLVSLATQVEEHLHLPLFKGEVRGSDWSQPLVMDQIVYAASDSYAGIHLYDTLNLKRLALDPTPPLPYHAELNKPIRIAEGIEIPSEDENEAEEPEPPVSTRKQPKKLSPSYLAKASETLELDPEPEGSSDPGTAYVPPTKISTTYSTSRPRMQSKTTSHTTTKSPSPLTQTQHALLASATQLADSYRATHHQNRASPASLRCYFLWHQNPSLSLSGIAGMLRAVPLQHSTVTGYIADAVKFEGLPYEEERMREVLGGMKPDVAWWRYKKLSKECGLERKEEQQ
ncbi:ribonuclease H-like domain-containing protein [Bisporella sp. PMI_857]|nr:ribonuclease H-like domain-containing protein [Bisporella sp. PMI_857]